MKTETQVTIKAGNIRASEYLSSEPEGFLIKVFLACSRTNTKIFTLLGEVTPITQTLKIANIGGKELQFWLCTTRDKIIANAAIPLPKELGESEPTTVDFKMNSTLLAVLDIVLTVSKREIEKIVYVEPDEELLKKVQDPLEKQRLYQEELKKQKQIEEQQKASRQVKKAAITITKYNKKDVPFV